MMRSLDKLIKFIGIALVPIGAVLIWKQHWVLELPMQDTVDATVAALIGMIPEGLYLLTSVALAVSMMRLARRKVLTRDMNSIETGGHSLCGQDRHDHRKRHAGRRSASTDGK